MESRRGYSGTWRQHGAGPRVEKLRPARRGLYDACWPGDASAALPSSVAGADRCHFHYGRLAMGVSWYRLDVRRLDPKPK